MWKYEKKLQYPINIKNPNPKYAQIIISQYGGPDGELGASMRYLTQRYSQPFSEVKGMLTDIMVSKEYQNKGVGKLIVTSLIKKLEDRVKENECFQLEASPTASNREFYIKCGLKYKPENQDGVYLWIRK